MTATKTAEKIFTKCHRCAGRGHFTCWQNIAGGACFACAGAGGVWETRAVVKARHAKIEAEKVTARAQMERNLDEMAPLHAIWDTRADLVVDRFEDIHPGALVSVVAREELWESDALWMQSVDSIRRNAGATGY